ncbi:hypothetical protein AGMMS49992_11150 [Clostridia bacterium]|nr:hypothetical protein AGMMS49992_11150 [Clostridia bacterium]
MAQRNPDTVTSATPAASTGRYKLRLKELREASGVSQHELARILKMPYTTYNGYENSMRKLPYDMLFTLSRYYNVPVEYILGFSDIS